MQRAQIEERLKGVFHSLFDVDPATLTTDSSQDTIPSWDSMQHLNLVLSIEQEFGVSLDDEQVVEMLSFGLIVEVLFEKLGREGA